MAGITEPVFRLLCRQAGADIVVSEMVSAEGAVRRAKNTTALLRFGDEERPLGIQLFGADPERLADAARYAEEFSRPDFIDLNSGCPVPKVAGRNAGAALLRDARLFTDILSAMVKAVSTPVTVKIRSGWREGEWVDVQYARIAQECGAAAITVHARSKTMGFGGRARWERIALVKQAVAIPVIGNGDVCDAAAAEAMLKETGCDAIMVGRGALGNPWIFSQIKRRLAGEPQAAVTPSMKRAAALTHLARYREMYGEQRASKEMKKHLGWYIKGLPGAARTRQKIFSARSTLEFERLLDEYFTVSGGEHGTTDAL